MYNDGWYDFDKTGGSHKAALVDGALLYRLSSVHHTRKRDVLSGTGSLNCPDCGRWNQPQQRTSYCANNVLVCMAEVLFHMYRRVLDGIAAQLPRDYICRNVRASKCLMIIRVKDIPDLVYLDSRGIAIDYEEARIAGTTVVFPDRNYKPFEELNAKARMGGKRGVVYPSARHSVDLCFALFNDETQRIRDDLLECLLVELQLVPEEQDPTQLPSDCDPFTHKLHPTMGCYHFPNGPEFERVRGTGAIYPPDLPQRGMIDYVRRRYLRYPSDAIREHLPAD